MAGIELKNIKKVYDKSFTAVHDFTLKIKNEEFIILVGPSGCGKSTTLRMIAGLEDITSGELYIGGRLVNDVQPKDRDIAMVFQNYALYPHMTVYQNMAFGLQMRKMPRDEIKSKIEVAAKSLDIESLLSRKPKALSGGQRQRVALGRAMVRDPAVFLLDEPLSNLDAKLRTQMRTQIKDLHRQLGTTFVYVTHDQTEAMTMGDRIVVMKDGYIKQVDTPQNLYKNPCNKFVAEFIGSPQMNFFKCKIVKHENALCTRIDGKTAVIPEEIIESTGIERYLDKDVLLGIRPEHMIVPEKVTEEARIVYFRGDVKISELMGAETYIHIKIGENETICKTSALNYKNSGDTILVGINMSEILFFENETGLRIYNREE